MGIKNYTILISIVFIVLFMSADQQNKDPFPGLVPAPADIEYLNSETKILGNIAIDYNACLLYTSPSPRDAHESRMPSSA